MGIRKKIIKTANLTVKPLQWSVQLQCPHLQRIVNSTSRTSKTETPPR